MPRRFQRASAGRPGVRKKAVTSAAGLHRRPAVEARSFMATMTSRKREAFIAGMAGGAIVSAGMTLARVLHLTAFNHEMLIGSLVLGRVGPIAWLIGLVTWIACAGLLGLGYALFFDRVIGEASIAMGVFLGFVQLFLVGFLILG